MTQLLINSVRASSIAGAIKVVGQIGVALIIYPAIVRQAGVAAIGSWVMLQLIVGYGGLVNLGMGAVVTQETARFKNPKCASVTDISLAEALLGSAAISFLLLIIVYIGSDIILVAVSNSFHQDVSPTSIWLMVTATIVRLVSSIYSAVIAGLQRSELVHISNFFQLSVYIICFFLIPNTTDIITHVALAYLLGYLVEIFIIIFALNRIAPHILASMPHFSINYFLLFIKKVQPYFRMDVALLSREPLLKLAMYICCGVEAVGLVELASKVPSAIRQAFLHGLSALMPAFSQLNYRSAQNDSVNLGQIALTYILFGAISALALYWINANFILMSWLGSVDENLVAMTLILTIWWGITSLNVPAWWLGIGTGHVKTNARIASIHLFFSILLVLVSTIITLRQIEIVYLWVAGGMVMQWILYYQIEKKTKLVVPIYLSKSILLHSGLIFTAILLAFIAGHHIEKVFLSPGLVLLSTGLIIALGSLVSLLVQFRCR